MDTEAVTTNKIKNTKNKMPYSPYEWWPLPT